MTEQNFASRLIASANGALDWTRGNGQIRVTLPGQPAKMMTFAEYKATRDGADPALGPIAECRAADDALSLINDRLDEGDEVAMCEHNQAADRCQKARQAMNGVMPVTMGGLQALVGHYVFFEEHPEGYERIAAVLDGCDSTLPISALRGGKKQIDQHFRVANPQPVFMVVEAHKAAWDAFQVAPEGDASFDANEEMRTTFVDLLATPIRDADDASVLARHLEWWLAEEAEFADDYQPDYSIAQARLADLTVFLRRVEP